MARKKGKRLRSKSLLVLTNGCNSFKRADEFSAKSGRRERGRSTLERENWVNALSLPDSDISRSLLVKKFLRRRDKARALLWICTCEVLRKKSCSSSSSQIRILRSPQYDGNGEVEKFLQTLHRICTKNLWTASFFWVILIERPASWKFQEFVKQIENNIFYHSSKYRVY